jgi:hypothetical protein
MRTLIKLNRAWTRNAYTVTLVGLVAVVFFGAMLFMQLSHQGNSIGALQEALSLQQEEARSGGTRVVTPDPSQIADRPQIITGRQGDAGTIGERGIPGPSGQNGRDGKNGNDGQSIVGPSGPPGTTGQEGAPGRNGTDGAPGRDGQNGEPGRPPSAFSFVGSDGATYTCTPDTPPSPGSSPSYTCQRSAPPPEPEPSGTILNNG